MFYVILGAVFAVAAAAVPFVAPSVAPLGLVWGGVAVLLLATGSVKVGRQRFRKRVLAEGIAGTAEIVSMARGLAGQQLRQDEHGRDGQQRGKQPQGNRLQVDGALGVHALVVDRE